MEVLQQFFESTQIPLLSAFFLGLMTAISPCPLATNITAIGFISKDIDSQKKVFINGLLMLETYQRTDLHQYLYFLKHLK